jgi:hypothetical protein
MQSERDGSTSSSRDNSSKFRWMMTTMMMMMMIFYGGISTNCTFQNSNTKRCDDDDGSCDGDLHQERMEDDEDGGTPMLSATGTLDRKTGQVTPMRQSATGTLDRKTDQASPTTCFHQRKATNKKRNRIEETNKKKRNQIRLLPTYTNNKPTDQLKVERPTRSRLRREDTTRMTTMKMTATIMRTQPTEATDESNRWKQPMEALTGTALLKNDDRTAKDNGKWNGGQMPTGWIDVCVALYSKAFKAATTARREGSQRWEQALEARTLLRRLVVRRHDISPLSADR